MSKYKIENQKSIMMDHVLTELQDIIKTIIVKKNYMAERQETIEMKQNADQYIAAVNKMDVFYTYPKYSKYALEKAGLYEERYLNDKTTIPLEKRDEVLIYQREYVITTYEEPNNYYRSLAGLPDVGDESIYITKEIEGIDNSIPIHEMDKYAINILSAVGELDKLKAKYPDKLYLNHLEDDYRIPIHIARKTADFEILYIKKNRTKQGVADSFIGLYRQVREYSLDKFYDEAYKKDSPYYDGFIGMFILCITMQRYISNYIEKFINRDFFNSDLIKLLFESYGLPFYKDIPLSYLQKVAKNLNRLIYYKASDKVFTDIFKIFDLNNIDIYNYVLFKDRMLDINGNPVEIYEEKTELGYNVDTVTYELKYDIGNFYGIKNTSYENIKKILCVNNITILLLNNGIVNFVCPEGTITTEFKLEKNEDNSFKFMDDFNITDIMELKGKDYYKILFKTKYPNKIYILENNTLIKKEFDMFYNGMQIEDIVYVADENIAGNMYIGLITKKSSHIFAKGTLLDYHFDDFTLIHDMEFPLISLAGNYGSIIAIDNRNVVYVYGDNEFNRLHVPFKDKITSFENIENRIYDVKSAYIFLKGTIFIMTDGSVRITGTIPEITDTITAQGENEILSQFRGIKRIQHWKCDKDVYLFYHYDGKIDVINYGPSDLYGPLLFSANIINPSLKIRDIRDIAPTSTGLLITTYQTDKYTYYSGENENRLFPYIKTMSMIKEANTFKMKDIEIFKNVMYFVTEDNKIIQYYNKSYNPIELKAYEDIQKFKQDGDYLFVFVGKAYFYILHEEYGIVKVIMNDAQNIVHDAYIYNNRIFITILPSWEIKEIVLNLDNAVDGVLSNITVKNVSTIYHNHTVGDESVTVKTVLSTGEITITYVNNVTNIIYSKRIVNLKSCDNVTLNKGVVLIEGYELAYIPVSELKGTVTVTAHIFDELNLKRAKSERVSDNLVIYNNNGGITLMRNFPHEDKLDSHIEGDYISLYDDTDGYIQDITFDKSNIVLLENINKVITYEPISEKMYNLKFIVTPMDTKNMAEQFVNTANYLDYDLVVDEDKLWGGDGDKSAFVKEVLNSEFNYVTSKYISVDCRYDLTKLNFEMCYMFRMLVDLKDNEQYLSFDIPYVGQVNLFDAIVGLFALTCMKLGFDGNIMDTTTKTMSVLGFNFKQDMDYIRQLVETANLKERDPDFNINKVDLAEPPAKFVESSEVINLFLDNKDILQNIYDYKYNAKTIQEYNAYKKIEQATLITDYCTDMYRRSDGTLPATYLDYLSTANPKLYLFIKETDDENMVQQIDTILMALDKFMDTDKLEYLFLNIPSLSLDNIRKFIYYLIDIFKSYTVDLKAMNIIYHIDDKRLSNIKLILEEDHFIKYFEDYTRYNISDYFDYVFGKFNEYTKLKLMLLDNPNGKFTEKDILSLFKIYQDIPTKVTEERMALLADFADVFDTMSDTMDYKNMIELIDKCIFEVIMPYYEKSLKELDDKALLLMKMNRKDKFNIKNKYDLIVDLDLKEKILIKIRKQLYSLYGNISHKLKIAFDKVIDHNKYDDEKDILPFDFADMLEANSNVDMYDKAYEIKDSFYFIRNE